MSEQPSLRRVAVVGGLRTPFCRVGSAFQNFTSLALMKLLLKGAVDHFGLMGKEMGEVALGSVFFHPESWNFARDSVIGSGLDLRTPARGMQRACATSLDAALVVAHQIASGEIESAIAGGAESTSNIALYWNVHAARLLRNALQSKGWKDRWKHLLQLRPHDFKPRFPDVVEPSTKLSMGQHCEKMAQEWKITRADQDQLAYQSHQNAHRAYEDGFYRDLILETEGVSRDNTLRSDTTLEKLSRLKPVFERGPQGTLTAGNSSPLTDGAAVCLLASEQWATKNNLPVLAHITGGITRAIDPQKEGLLMAPAYAVGALLEKKKLSLQDFDFYEIHEAFAAQVLCTLQAWESDAFCKRIGLTRALGPLDRSRLNVVGGSVALGHPFGATGARLIAGLAKLLATHPQAKRGLISICTGGGMGTVAILERT